MSVYIKGINTFPMNTSSENISGERLPELRTSTQKCCSKQSLSNSAAMPLRIFTALLSALLVVCVVNGQEPGERCRTTSNTYGLCIDIKNCQWAAEQIAAGITPAVCEGTNDQIICCSSEGRVGYVTEATKNSISYKKCIEYSQVSHTPSALAPVTTRPKPGRGCTKKLPTVFVSTNSTQCSIPSAVKHTTRLVVGGKPALSNEFPHMAVLGFGPVNSVTWKCGGSLISEKYVLTAGHCLYDLTLGDVAWVRLGDINITSSTDDANVQQFGITRRVKEPSYKAPSFYNDLALLELNGIVTFTIAVRPACIHHVDGFTSPNVLGIVTGWGKTSNSGGFNDVLMKADLVFVNATTCNDTFDNFFGTKKLRNGINGSQQICAIDPAGEKDTCQGDSGGPIQLVLRDPDCVYVIVGVTSFGQTNCAVQGDPSVYARIMNYIPWIESVVWPNQ